MCLTWILGSEKILSDNQSRATLWVLATCLIVGLLPFMIILDHCFVVFKHIEQCFLMRNWTFEGDTINIIQHVDYSLRSLVWPVIFVTVSQRVAPFYHGSEIVFPRTRTVTSHTSRAGILSNLNPAYKEMISDFDELCETEVCFLTHPTCWNKCMTSKKRTLFLQK